MLSVPGLSPGESSPSTTTLDVTVPEPESVAPSSTTTIVEGHADYQGYGLNLRTLYAVASVDDVEQLNALRSLTGNASIGERMVGGFAEIGFDVLSRLDSSHQLSPYVRYELMNTQDEVPAGFAANPVNDRTAWLIGAMWKPVPEVALKADYQLQRNEANSGVNQLNVNLSYLF